MSIDSYDESSEVAYLRKADTEAQEEARRAMRVLSECSDIFFDRARVALHVIDVEGTLLDVNPIWAKAMGYDREQVVGRKSIEFVTDESRARALADGFPQFERIRFPQTRGLQFVRRDGRVMDVLLDARFVDPPGAKRVAYAAFCDVNDRASWRQGPSTLRSLQELAYAGRRYEAVVSGSREIVQDLCLTSLQDTFDHATEAETRADVVAGLIELVGDISANLAVLPKVHEEWLSVMAEHQQELVQVAKSIDRTLQDLADTIASTDNETRAR